MRSTWKVIEAVRPKSSSRSRLFSLVMLLLLTMLLLRALLRVISRMGLAGVSRLVLPLLGGAGAVLREGFLPAELPCSQNNVCECLC